MGVHGKKGRSGEDLGKIHRSRECGVQECREREKSGGTRTARCPRVRGIEEGQGGGGPMGV